MISHPAESEPLWRELLELQSASFKPDDWRLADNRSHLGASLLAQSKFAEAEPFLIQGFTGLAAAKETPRTPNDDLREACERVVHLYEVWDKAEPGKGLGAKAAEWKAKLDAINTPAPTPEPAEKR